MSLRKKVLLIFLAAFVVFCSVYGVEFFLSNELSQNRLFKAVLTGQTSTWRKVREATYERMLFYAYDAKPGKPSVWRLRGRRSPVEAVLSGNPKKVRRAILPLYKNLAKDGILDVMWVFDSQDSPLLIVDKDYLTGNYRIKTKDNNLISNSILELLIQTRESRSAQKQFITSNGKIFATISFPIFSNARVAGTVVYGREISPLVEDLAINTKSEVFVFHSKSGFIFGTNPKLSQLAESRFLIDDYALLDSGSAVFLANSLKFPLRGERVQLVFMLDITREYKKQQLYYLITLALMILVAAALIAMTNFLLKRGFKPLDRAIDVLNALSAGDTTVDLETKGEDEVGRIASTVSSFRKSLIEREKVRNLFGKYIPETIAEKLIKEDGTDIMGGQETEATILFSDMRGFTNITETLGAQGTVSLLNEYFDIMVETISEQGGMVDKFIGDAIMAAFGIPVSHGDDEDRGVLAGINMISRLWEWNVEREKEGKIPIDMRLGLNTDNIVSGNIGSSKRMDYTMIGDGVNLAARLESACKQYSARILISDFTYKKLNRTYQIRYIDDVVVKGKTEPVGVREVLDYHDKVTFPNLMDTVDHFNEAREHYKSGDWDKAAKSFNECLKANPGDKLSKMYIERVNTLKKSPPKDWDGVWVMTSK